MSHLPPMSPEQRRDALAKAAYARRERSEALGALKTGTVTLAEVLADETSPLQKVPVSRVLRALKGVGPVKAAQIMDEVGIAENRRVKGLSPQKREALTARLAA